jgi:hypothetical protein
VGPQVEHHFQFSVELQQESPARRAAIAVDMVEELVAGNAAVLSLAGPPVGGGPQDGVNLRASAPVRPCRIYGVPSPSAHEARAESSANNASNTSRVLVHCQRETLNAINGVWG